MLVSGDVGAETYVPNVANPAPGHAGEAERRLDGEDFRPGVGAEVAAVLAAHALIRWTTAAGRGGSWSQCACGVGRSPTPESHAAHQADALAPLVAERVEAAKAEALREAAAVMDGEALGGSWASEWLRDRAAALDPEEG